MKPKTKLEEEKIMTYQDDNERKRVEEIERRLRDETFIPISLGSYAKCRVYKTDGFIARFANLASDITALTAMYLYAMGDGAPAYNQFSYITQNSGKLYYRVLRVENYAVFCVEQESDKIESYM